MKRPSESDETTEPAAKKAAVDDFSNMLTELETNGDLVPLYIRKQILGKDTQKTRVDALLEHLAALVGTSNGKTTCMAQFQAASADAVRPGRGHIHICVLNFLSERGYGALPRN